MGWAARLRCILSRGGATTACAQWYEPNAEKYEKDAQVQNYNIGAVVVAVLLVLILFVMLYGMFGKRHQNSRNSV